MDIITALYGLQTFQDTCLASVDMVFRRILASMNFRSRVGVASTKRIASQGTFSIRLSTNDVRINVTTSHFWFSR